MKKNHCSDQLEKIPTAIFSDNSLAAKKLAQDVKMLIQQKQTEGKNVVLGLATGSTPLPFYNELVKLHRDDGLSFKNVISFNLDEYYPIEKHHKESYHTFMHNHLFSHVDMLKENIHIPDGAIAKDNVHEFCARYEDAIEMAGGIDLQVLGIGRNGHIGFNEPGSSKDSKTRLVTLDSKTRQDAAEAFMGEQNVPLKAITMGVGTILKARAIIIMAWGVKKAPIVQKALEEGVDENIPATFLQQHSNVQFFLDKSASSELTCSHSS